jgi:hypothetical protein
MLNSEIGATKYLTLYTGCSINQCRYNRVVLYVCCSISPLPRLQVFKDKTVTRNNAAQSLKNGCLTRFEFLNK